MCTLKLKIRNNGLEDWIHVHNIYNPSPVSRSSTEGLSTLPDLRRALIAGANAKHIVVGDFNLHHPYWSGPSRPSQHAAADQLLDIIEEADLELVLLPGTITWEARQSCSTIDLVFLSADLVPKLEHCKTRSEMEQSSDHIPISTKLLLQCEARTTQPRRAWKMMDMEKLRKLLDCAPAPQHPRNRTEIDLAVEEIQTFLCEVVDKTVPWARPSDWAKPFWSQDYNTAMIKTRNLRKIWSKTRQPEDWQAYMKANDKKQKIIDKAKRLHYRQAISDATSRLTEL